MHAPQVVVIHFDGGGHLEAGDAHALRVDAVEDGADDAVLAAGVHALQDDQQPAFVLGEHALLQHLQLQVELLSDCQRIFFITLELACAGRIQLVQVDLFIGFDSVAVQRFTSCRFF